ncbi:MAG: ABC transporter permease [Treponema sp.]|jgi:putative ABC transport system permease protein|nr:ABC transporter permease [Treponema sp.]
MWEDFINALNNFKRNKTRTFLSLLGVIIGVASVIVITSMGKSSTKEVEKTFGQAGLDVVSVNAGKMKKGSQSNTIVLDEAFRTELFDNIDNIKKIWYKNTLSATIAYGETSSTVSCSAVETGYLEMYNMQLEYGSFFNVTDNEEGTQKIILNHETAQDYFPAGDALGKQLILVASNVSFCFEIIGVLKDQTTGMEGGAAFIPRGFYSKKIKPNPSADSAMVQAVSNQKALELVTTIGNYCTEKTGNSYAVRINSMQTMIDQMSKITGTMSMMLSAIAAISLLVGGIGIMNIMIVTVTERKGEIGIRKALGASPNDIRQQFLIESASITLIGGVLGVISGIIISLAVEYVQKQAYVISTQACLIAFIFSVFVGIFFGLNPASRAAKLDPVIALSGE